MSHVSDPPQIATETPPAGADVTQAPEPERHRRLLDFGARLHDGTRPSPLALAVGVLGTVAALVLAFVVFEVWVTGILESRSQTALLSTFKGSLSQSDSPNLVTPPPGQPVGVIEIPALNLEQVVVQGTSSADTKLGPGHDPSTPAPGQIGNAVIVGRRVTYGAPFGNLGSLRTGDPITVLTREGGFVYKVTGTRTVALGDPAVAAQGSTNQLTLITAASSAFPSSEVVVTAKLSGAALAVPAALPLPSSGFQPGKSTGFGGWGPILLWGELLLVAFGLIWYVRRRRASPVVVALVAAPVAITLTYLLFTSVDTLLYPSL
jgi:sortase A